MTARGGGGEAAAGGGKVEAGAAKRAGSGAGRLLVLSGPSGVGKTTVTDRLVERCAVRRSVSATTRPPRPGEVDGVHYRFLDQATFRRWIDEEAFLEWAEVHGHLYGTPRAPVEEALRRGEVVLLEIDVQGAAKLRGDGVPGVYVFLAPPSPQALAQRLRGRGTEEEGVVRRRLETARREMAQRGSYDHVVENDVLERAVAAIEALAGIDPRSRHDPAAGVRPRSSENPRSPESQRKE